MPRVATMEGVELMKKGTKVIKPINPIKNIPVHPIESKTIDKMKRGKKI